MTLLQEGGDDQQGNCVCHTERLMLSQAFAVTPSDVQHIKQVVIQMSTVMKWETN